MTEDKDVYPVMVYKKGTKIKVSRDEYVDGLTIPSCDLEQAMADGWSETPREALEKAEAKAKAKARTAPQPRS